jgi:hypothetical protein
MHTDRQIALWGGWIAGPAFGVAMMAAPEYLHLKPAIAATCFWGGLLVFVVTVFVLAALQSREREERKSMWPIVTMAAGMIIFGIGIAGYFWPQHQASSETSPVGNWSWDWAPLTVSQQDQLFEKLKALPKQEYLYVACDNGSCTALAASLIEVFNKLQWKVHPFFSSSGLTPGLPPGVTGAFLSKQNEETTELKRAIESVSPLKISFHPMGEPYTLYFGAKPLPDFLPDREKQELRETGGQMKQLSTELSGFAEDRNREFSRLPAVKSGVHPETDEAIRRQDFNRETGTLMQLKFGSRITTLTAQAARYGIRQAWQVASRNDSPQMFSKWFFTVGQHLQDGQLVDARKIAADDNFWFHQ